MAIQHKEAIDKVAPPVAENQPVLGVGQLTYPVNVRNTHFKEVSLQSGVIQPGEEGLATLAEVSCFLDKYVELV